VQTTGFDPVQTPATQESVCVHALPSLQDPPSLPFVWKHWPPVHVSVVHAFPSLQSASTTQQPTDVP
jgi:hypothetical protein